MHIHFYTALPWSDYELLDSGQSQKIERFGPYLLIRPEPQAIWPLSHPISYWMSRAHAHFERHTSASRPLFADLDGDGGWKKLRPMPNHWIITYSRASYTMQLRMALTRFGHVGVFPEQSLNWDYIHQQLAAHSSARVLNLFAYTGAASIVARLAGAQVTHVDSSRPALSWARQNMEINRLAHIRWVHEDVLKFVRREVRRGRSYTGIIMDPPPYGRGPDKEKWVLTRMLDELMALSQKLLRGDHTFFVLSLYATGLSARISGNIVASYFSHDNLDVGEFCLPTPHPYHLPMGTYVRFSR